MDNDVKIISISDVWSIVLRRRWLIMVPFFISMVVGIIMSLVLPRAYQAETLILVEPQRVPSSYVRSLVSSDIETRINTISQQIMSRTSLEKIINDFSLFSDRESRELFIEDKLRILRKKISVKTTRASGGTNAFSITFKDENPDKVANVVNALSAYFIDENLKVREAQAVGTSDFLEDELATMRSRLEYLEDQLKSFREKYMGELPEQLETNLRLLDRLQEQLTERQTLLREAKTRLSALLRQPEPSSEPVVIYQPAPNTPIASDGQSLGDLRRQLNNLKGRYTDEHPDVKRIEKLISEMIAKHEQALKAAQADPSKVAPHTFNPETHAQIIDVRREIRGHESSIAEVEKEIRFYQNRVENTPKREQQLLSLNRDYSNIQESYSSLLSRKLEAEIAVNMERKQKGEQFRIIDSAKRPEKPIEPNMIKLLILFVLLGCIFGAGTTFVVEYLSDYFRSPDDVEAFTGIPVIGSIPKVMQQRDLLLARINKITSVAMCAVTIIAFVSFVLISMHGDTILSAIEKT